MGTMSVWVRCECEPRILRPPRPTKVADGGFVSNNPRGFGEGLNRPLTPVERYGAYAGESLKAGEGGLSHTKHQSEFGCVR